VTTGFRNQNLELFQGTDQKVNKMEFKEINMERSRYLLNTDEMLEEILIKAEY